MQQNECKPDCNRSWFKRLNFFHGMLLSEQDFIDEQEYLREKNKIHNRLLHGYGIVVGLRLEKKELKSQNKSFCEVVVEPGVALDCEGNEIIVCHEHHVNLNVKIEELKKQCYFKDHDQCSPPDILKKLNVGISYCECKSDPAPQYTSGCGDDRLHPEYSRVREGFRSQLFTEEELPGCPEYHAQKEKSKCHKPDDICPGAFQCAAYPHWVIIGWIEILDSDISDCCSINVVVPDKKFYPAIHHF
jgi:hypothetical protein